MKKLKRGIVILSFLFSFNLFSESNPPAKKSPLVEIGIFYYKNLFGHIHQNRSRYSASLTTISCGHPLRLLAPKNGEKSLDDWVMIRVGPYEGYLPEKAISEKKVDCFQDRYIKFFDNMDLQLSDMYYWGRFYDQVVEGKSKVK